MEVTQLIEIRVPYTVFGVGAVGRLGELAKSYSPARPLVVTDPGLVKAGIVDTVRAALDTSGLTPDVFDACGREAPVSAIEQLRTRVEEGGHGLLIGVGGGSVMDTTKAASLLVATPGLSVADLIDGKPAAGSLPKIMIPTTAGTGSEWSSTAVVTTDTTDDRTYPYITPLNYPQAVIIDPALTRELPARTTAETGIDALTHAIEAYTCSRANLLSDMYACNAMAIISTSLRPAYAKGPTRIQDRYQLSIAAAMAMLAGSLAGVGLAHFMNHALGKLSHLSHGATVGLMLPYVMEYNLISDPVRFAEIARILGEDTRDLSTMDAAQKSVLAVRRLLSDLDMPQTLTEVGLTARDIPFLVDELMTLQAFPIAFMNPREVGSEQATQIYANAL